MVEGKLPQEDSSTDIQTSETKLSIAISRTDAVIRQLMKSNNESGKTFESDLIGSIS